MSDGENDAGSGWNFRSVCGWPALVALAMLCAAESFAWLLPQRLDDTDLWYVRAVSFALYVRVFQFHLGLVALALVVGLLATLWRRSAAFVTVLACVLLMPYARDFAPKNPPPAVSPTFRLMSMNLYYLNRDEAAVMRAIDAANPDVIVMLEVTPWARSEIINRRLPGRYTYVNQPAAEGVGIVLTRLPFRVGNAVPSETGVYARHPVLLNVGGKDVALYGMHFLSPGSPRLVEANRVQVEKFIGIARQETHPMIIAGDCNFSQLTPNAAAFRSEGFRSTHELIGFGLGDTWGPKWWPWLNRLPGVRIDHIWLSPGLTATSHVVGLDTGSDHRPVIADIGLAAGH